MRVRKTKIDYKDFGTAPIYDLREYEYKSRKYSRSLISVGKRDIRNLVVLILVTLVVRLYRIDQPTSVV